MAILTLSICLSKLPKERIRVGSDGLKYIDLVAIKRKEPDKIGNTHFIALSQTKQEKESSAQTVFVGSGKEYSGQQSQQPKKKVNYDFPQPIGYEDIPDLPF